jgi:hypothetical protein
VKFRPCLVRLVFVFVFNFIFFVFQNNAISDFQKLSVFQCEKNWEYTYKTQKQV